jgi:hypothetical protein
LKEQTKLKLEELENERSICRDLSEKMDYKISLNEEIREWRKLCYEQSDKIQHYMSLELGSSSNPQSNMLKRIVVCVNYNNRYEVNKN